MTTIHLFYSGLTLSVIALAITAALFFVYQGRLRRLPESTRYEDLRERLEGVRAQLEAFEKERQALRDQLHDLERDAGAARGVAAEAEALKRFLDENRHKAAEVEATLHRAETTRQQLTEAEAGYQRARTEFEQIRDQSEAAKHEAAEERRNVDALQRQISTAKSELKDTQIRLRETSDKFAALSGEKDALAHQVEKLRGEDAELQRQCAEYEQKMAAMHDRSIELSEVNSALEVDGRKLHHIREQIASEQQIQENILNRTDNVSSLLSPDTPTRLQDLFRPYLSPNGAADPLDASDENLVLRQFSDSLRSAGLVFSERTVLAFHTSLKIADIAPLVVLAGISGTGKSLLPGLYAKFFGLHFLPISIQPRWDGPQDLFGFYNYMENRYKATELTRTLWQMDRYNNPAADEPAQRIQDGLALVLLDEMNLARVEYYFSELLSKLEMRRSIDPNAADQRRIAEIEIESGAMSADETNLRLFVGGNVLFVGTMNEDETTQALSDKVVDRANILRFGKPAESAAELVNLDQFGGDSYLRLEDWQRWQRQALPPEAQTWMRNYLQRVNNALVRVGRPFGYRVQQAIEQYVANYPGQGASAHTTAFADQLEQKIIPKLIGLDPTMDESHATYTELEGVIQELDDPALLTAFDVARDKPFFQWSGVDRG
jgi:predicted  nucleic acid-binding Zn-ribbon protein